MKGLVKYLNCGMVFLYPKRSWGEFKVYKLDDIINQIIPLFNQYPLQGSKRADYLDFCKVVELMKNKAHLTAEGLEQIRKIKSGMNGRDHVS
jgi:hypothetical protein